MPIVIPAALLGTSLTLIYFAYHFILYPFFLSPLRHIPRAHWSVPIPYIGSLWILYHRFKSRNNTTTYAAHLTGGPVVRLADNEISVNCYEGGLRTVYAGGWEKHEWYPRQFANFGVMNMFSTVGHTTHATKKRTMAHIYSKSFLQTSEQVAANSRLLLEQRFLPLLQSLAGNGEVVDVHEINNAFTMDFMTAFQFGIGISTNFTQDVEVRRKYLHLYHSRRDWQFISSEVPPQIRKLLQVLGVSLFPDFVHKANEWLENWSRQMCDAADKYLGVRADPDEPRHSTNAGNEPLVFRQYKTALHRLRAKDPTAGFEYHSHLDEGMNFSGLAKLPSSNSRSRYSLPDEKITTLEVYSDMVDQLAAGHETSALALTYLYYELSKSPELQDRLHTELLSLSPQIQWPGLPALEIPDPKTIDALPFLSALLQETLRLHTPIPGMQPRISPNVAGGNSLGPPGTKDHYTNLPGNIRVSAMPYTLHRLPSVFPDPHKFLPDRWLTASPEQLREMNRHFWAFGSGGRMCIGSHLAIQEIKLIVAAMYTNYKTEIAPGGDDGIEEVDAYTTRPRSGKLMLKFSTR